MKLPVSIPERGNVKRIFAIKMIRVAIAQIITLIDEANGGGRELSLVKTKLQESRHWLGQELAECSEPTPYPQADNPESAVVEPSADMAPPAGSVENPEAGEQEPFGDGDPNYESMEGNAASESSLNDTSDPATPSSPSSTPDSSSSDQGQDESSSESVEQPDALTAPQSEIDVEAGITDQEDIDSAAGKNVVIIVALVIGSLALSGCSAFHWPFG
jgi:hypothetical protein